MADPSSAGRDALFLKTKPAVAAIVVFAMGGVL
jgi:hypothetical protein